MLRSDHPVYAPRGSQTLQGLYLRFISRDRHHSPLTTSGHLSSWTTQAPWGCVLEFITLSGSLLPADQQMPNFQPLLGCLSLDCSSHQSPVSCSQENHFRDGDRCECLLGILLLEATPIKEGREVMQNSG